MPVGAYAEQELALEDEELSLDTTTELEPAQEDDLELDEYEEPELQFPEELDEDEASEAEVLEVEAQSIPPMYNPATGSFDDVLKVRGTARYDLANRCSRW